MILLKRNTKNKPIKITKTALNNAINITTSNVNPALNIATVAFKIIYENAAYINYFPKKDEVNFSTNAAANTATVAAKTSENAAEDALKNNDNFTFIYHVRTGIVKKNIDTQETKI